MKLKTKKQTRFTKLTQPRRLHAVVFILSIAVVGGYWVLHSKAEYEPGSSPNPPLTRACGLDVALLVDMSGSMRGTPKDNAFAGMRSFVNTLRGTQTQIAIGTIDAAEYPVGDPPFTPDTDEALRRIDSFIQVGNSYVGKLWGLVQLDPRPDRPNLIVILSDFAIGYDQASVNAVKQSGTRILALSYGGSKGLSVAIAIAGPNVDTSSIFTSDVVQVDPSTIEARFEEFAHQLCFSGATPGVTPGLGGGNGGTGIGTNGQGQGQGPSSGAGGGGSNAKKIAEQPNTVPTSSSQGGAKPTDQDPSPFFDGKEFKPGSDRDTLVFGNSTIAGKKVPKIVLYLISALLLGGAGGGLYWKWKRKVRP